MGRYAIALGVTKYLIEDGALGVAVTGSLARGDDAAGSDVDLWVLGKTNERVNVMVRGVQVTWLRETIHRVFDLRHLSRVEVKSIKVLFDPLGIFKRVQAFHRKHERALVKETLFALRAEAEALNAASERGPKVTRLLLAREALQFSVLATLYEKHGLRTPKFRHVRRLLGRPFARRYARALGLAEAPRWARAFQGLIGKGTPNNTLAKLDAGAFEEAHLLARLEVIHQGLELSGSAMTQLRSVGRRYARLPPSKRGGLAAVFSIPPAAELDGALRVVRELGDPR